MANRLADALSPYLRSHAENPVDWRPWGDEPFAEAARRDVPVLVSIGYSTCHWCHVMARESFSDPALAAVLNENFVAIKVDREEHPGVDASYLAAAGAFTGNLGWPLNVFVTPQGRAFFAGTYWPPEPVAGHPSFRQVLGAVIEAWRERRSEVEGNAAAIATALAAAAPAESSELPSEGELTAAVAELGAYEDAEHGGFGGAPKFPSTPVLLFLLERAADGDGDALALAERTLTAIAASALRDPVDGGFFRYATRRDWTEPHYERMLTDNALLLTALTRLERLRPGTAMPAVEGVAGFLLNTMELPGGGFASAQDSESTVDGARVEGDYYGLDAHGRARQTPPALDAKLLTGWNGLAIDALAEAGFAFARPGWLAAARRAADRLLETHRRPDGTLLRASLDGRASAAVAGLEDYGMLASGLLRLATATGEPGYAVAARGLVDACLAAGAAADAVRDPAEDLAADPGAPFAVPGGGDPVLVAQGLALDQDLSEGAAPSGPSALADACLRLFLVTADGRYLDAATAAMRRTAPLALRRPIAFGAALAVTAALRRPVEQLVVVGPADSALAAVARRWPGGSVVAAVTAAQASALAAAGLELFAGRAREAAYLCRDFVCRLPVTAPDELRALLGPRHQR